MAVRQPVEKYVDVKAIRGYGEEQPIGIVHCVASVKNEAHVLA